MEARFKYEESSIGPMIFFTSASYNFKANYLDIYALSAISFCPFYDNITTCYMKSLNAIQIPKTVERILNTLIEKTAKIRPDLIEGFYLTGSIPLNDFHPNKSDIDFIILCKYFPEQYLFQQLKKLHGKIQQKYKRPKLRLLSYKRMFANAQ